MTASTDRSAAIALIAGSVAGLATMALHPTGRDVVGNAMAGGSNALNVAVHSLALVGQGFVLAGALAIVMSVRARIDLGVAGYVFYALSSVAILNAAVASGFLATSVTSGLAHADEAHRASIMGALGYTGLINQAFARVSVIFSSLALLSWSWAILQTRSFSRGLGVYGLVLGALLLVGILSGLLRLDIHGFGAVVLGQGLWFVGAAGQLWRHPNP